MEPRRTTAVFTITRGGSTTREPLLPDLSAIQQALRGSVSAPDRDSLRGHEGTAAVHYFHALRALLADQVPVERPLAVEAFVAWVDGIYDRIEPLRGPDRSAWEPQAIALIESHPLPSIG